MMPTPTPTHDGCPRLRLRTTDGCPRPRLRTMDAHAYAYARWTLQVTQTVRVLGDTDTDTDQATEQGEPNYNQLNSVSPTITN